MGECRIDRFAENHTSNVRNVFSPGPFCLLVDDVALLTTSTYILLIVQECRVDSGIPNPSFLQSSFGVRVLVDI